MYRDVTTLIYGIAIPENVAKELFDKYLNPDTDDLVITDASGQDLGYFRKAVMPRARLLPLTQQHPITPYPEHDGGIDGMKVFTAGIWPQGTDAVIDLEHYSPGFPHFVGIEIGTDLLQDKILDLAAKPLPEAVANFQKLIGPICKKYNLTETPKMHLIKTQNV